MRRHEAIAIIVSVKIGKKDIVSFLVFGGSIAFFSVMFFLNRTFMGNFDESDHIVAGYLMKSGRLLYSGNFSHHFPFPYYWVYLFTPLWSAASPARTIAVLRLSLLVLYLFCYLLVFLTYRSNKSRLSFSLWLIIVSLFFVVYHGYVVISESFDAVFISSIMWIVLPYLLKWEKPGRTAYFLLILYGSLVFWTQPLMGILLLVPFFMMKDWGTRLRFFLAAALMNTLPLMLFFLSGQLSDFLYQGLYFNFIVYPKYYLDSVSQGGTMLGTAALFFRNEYLLLTEVANPLQQVQFVFHLAFLWMLYRVAKTKNVRFIILFLLIFLATRIREVKAVVGVAFSSGMYPFILFAAACFVVLIYEMYRLPKRLGKAAAVVLLVYILGANFLASREIILQSLKPGYNYHVFWSYRQETGNTIKALSLPTEHVLVYPHDVELYYFADRTPPDRFTYWFPWINAVPEYRNERLYALQNNPPPVIRIGGVVFKGDSNFYMNLFPGLTRNYVPVLKDNKKTGIWLRKDLQDRLKKI